MYAVDSPALDPMIKNIICSTLGINEVKGALIEASVLLSDKPMSKI
jgi:hypothetical protein